MKAMKSTLRYVWLVRLIIMIVLPMWGQPVWGQPAGVRLMLDQNPTEGGSIIPDSGIHQYIPNSEITVTAVPQPGYRFAYWLGDVSNPSASSTQVQMSDSKSLVAVFEKVHANAASEDDQTFEIAGGGGGGPSGLMPSTRDFFTTSFSISGGAVSPNQTLPPPIMIQTPEPTTVLLLGLGGTYLVRRRTSNRISQQA